MSLLKKSTAGFGSEAGPPGSGLEELRANYDNIRAEQEIFVYSAEYRDQLVESGLAVCKAIRRTEREVARYEAREIRSWEPKEQLHKRLGRKIGDIIGN